MLYTPQTYLTHCPQCVTIMHREKGYTCSVVLPIIVIGVPRWPHSKFREIVRPPNPLIDIEPCSHLINVVSQARMILVEMGIDLKLMLQGTDDILVLLEQVPKILVILTRSWHVWRRHRLLRHMLLLLALRLIFLIPEMHIIIFGLFFSEAYLVHWCWLGRELLKCCRV